MLWTTLDQGHNVFRVRSHQCDSILEKTMRMNVDGFHALAIDDHGLALRSEIRVLVRDLRVRGIDQAARAKGQPGSSRTLDEISARCHPRSPLPGYGLLFCPGPGDERGRHGMSQRLSQLAAWHAHFHAYCNPGLPVRITFRAPTFRRGSSSASCPAAALTPRMPRQPTP